MSRPIRIVNVAEADPPTRWIADRMDSAGTAWTGISAKKRPGIEQRIAVPHLGRLRAGWQARRAARRGADVIVSHGPYTTYYCAQMLGASSSQPHLAVSFNFTDIPGGRRFKIMKQAFQSIDRFMIFSRMEQALYSGLFEIPAERFDFVYWGVKPPILAPRPKRVEGRYFVAMGGEARDYRTLVETARLRPTEKFVFIVRPWSLEGLDVPGNVEVHVNLPWEDAWSIVWHAHAVLLPLRSGTTPNGHVTVVGGMHIGKAHIVTDSVGITDYVGPQSAILVPQADAQAFARGIDRLLDEPDTVAAMGAAARAFAQAHCTEERTVDYFAGYLADLRARGRIPA